MFSSRGKFIVNLVTETEPTNVNNENKKYDSDSNLEISNGEQNARFEKTNEDQESHFLADSPSSDVLLDEIFDAADTSSDDFIPGTDEESSSSSRELTRLVRKSNAVRYKSPDIFDTDNKVVDLYCNNSGKSNNSKISTKTENSNAVSLDEPVNKKKRIYPIVDKTSRKRKCNPSNWKRQRAKIARESGNEYVSYNGQVNLAKHVTPGNLCNANCRLNCTQKFNDDERKTILSNFYHLNVNAKNALLFNCISVSAVKRFRAEAKRHKKASYKYHINFNGSTVVVCKTALCSLYQIGRKKVDIIKNKIRSGVSAPLPDKRGSHNSRPHKTAEDVEKCVMEHISSFPADMSHYSRNNNPHKKYLSPFLTISKMHRLYIEFCEAQNLPKKFHVKQCVYRKIFVTKFNLSFSAPKSDTCSTCDAGKQNEEHIENYKRAFEAQKHDRDLARSTDDMMYLTIDLQQTMPLPKLTTSKAFYLRQLWFYNLGLHAIAKTLDKAVFCTWTEDVGGKGSTEVCSSLLTAIEFGEQFKGKKHLVVWSDSCGGQNKNFQIVCLYQYLILKGYFNIIDHKYPEVGHSYLDCDRDFGRIEKQLRKHENIYLPDHYRDIVNEVSKKNKVINMKDHFRSIDKLAEELQLINRKKDFLKEKVCFRDGVKWVRVEEYGSYLFKANYDDFTPFRKVNILRHQKKESPSLKKKANILKKNPQMFILPRAVAKKGDVAQEKLKDIEAQLQYVPEEFRWFYHEVIAKFQ